MDTEAAPFRIAPLRRRPLEAAWRAFCRGVVRVFYRSCETDGLHHVPARGPVLLCANHPNALIDAVVVQAVSRRIVHPLARSGLFRNPLLRPFLALMQAVPVHRRQDADADPARNEAMFGQCYRLLGGGGALLIFPEGETHADPSLHRLKTGAARLALGARLNHGLPVALVPVGLNFTDAGRFRSKVLVKVHPALDVTRHPDESDEAAMLRVTGELGGALRRVTLNAETWQELDLIRRLERFFWLRRGRYRRRSQRLRFRAQQRLVGALQVMKTAHPAALARLSRRLEQFERLRRRFGVQDYHLTFNPSPGLVLRFVARSLAVLIGVVPVAAWGALNGGVPYALTGALAVALSSDRYHYATAKAALGLVLFPAFWAAQTYAVHAWLGPAAAAAYALILPVSGAVALYARRERERILDNMRVFFLFLRRQKLRRLLEDKRTELEQELRRLARLAAGAASRQSAP